MRLPLRIVIIASLVIAGSGGAWLHHDVLQADEANYSRLSSNSRRSVSLHLHNIKNSQYVGAIGVGTPAQRVSVIFDTGSANTWITSSRCGSPSCRSHPAFDASLSKTYVSTGDDVQVRFGTGQVEGRIGVDAVEVAGLRIRRQSFGEVTHEVGAVFMVCGVGVHITFVFISHAPLWLDSHPISAALWDWPSLPSQPTTPHRCLTASWLRACCGATG